MFDAWSPLHVWVSNLQMSRGKLGLLRWVIWRGQAVERWGEGIQMLGEWGFFDRPEPRLAHIRRMRPIEAVGRTLRVYHFRLGEPAPLGTGTTTTHAC